MGGILPFAESLINKGKQANYKKKLQMRSIWGHERIARTSTEPFGNWRSKGRSETTTAITTWLREWAIANTSSVTLYLWEFQRLGKIFPIAKSLINKEKHQNFKKKHFLFHLETFSLSLYLSEFQRLGRKVTFARSLINKGKHQNSKKKQIERT